MTYKANYWVNKGWEITILTFDDGSTPPFYNLDSRVRHIPLGIAGKSPNLIAKLYSNLKRIAVLRTAIRKSKPDAVITIGERSNVITLLATRGLKVPVVVSTQTDPASYSIGRVWEQLRLWTYPWADQVIAHTERTLASYPHKVQSCASVIPNPVKVPPTGNASVNTRLKKPSLIAMGRFVHQKGFDLLLRAFAQLKDRYPDWTLTILGEGPLRMELESLRDELGLADRVLLPGIQKNPHEILKQADLFVFTSRFEGFGNALCEAMACGLPVISTDCRSGPREIIRDGVDGLLVPPEDVDSLAAAMGRLMSDEAERKRLASRAVEVTERFGLEKVMRMWEEVLNNVTRKRS
ncbi:MAG: glycosyltransferase family 4 protein [Candidatus Brocadiales bacterium]|nr:glycosyltransferase family 4 protein [Candidatus Bathyanammoxibius sp.]